MTNMVQKSSIFDLVDFVVFANSAVLGIPYGTFGNTDKIHYAEHP